MTALYTWNRTFSISLATSWTNTSVIFKQVDPGSRPWRYGSALWSTKTGFRRFGGLSLSGFTDDALWDFHANGDGGGTWQAHQDNEAAVFGLYGAACGSSLAVGYCLGGVHETGNSNNRRFMPSSELFLYNLTSDPPKRSNISHPNANFTNWMGVTQMIPELGGQGVLVFMGGSLILGDPSYDYLQGSPSKLGPVKFDTVTVFDPVSQQWGFQKTGGSPPAPRSGACSVLVRSQMGSYELYVCIHLSTDPMTDS
jgi:hypothetical protein